MPLAASSELKVSSSVRGHHIDGKLLLVGRIPTMTAKSVLVLQNTVDRVYIQAVHLPYGTSHRNDDCLFITPSFSVRSGFIQAFVHSDRSRDSRNVIMGMYMLKYRECARECYGLFQLHETTNFLSNQNR